MRLSRFAPALAAGLVMTTALWAAAPPSADELAVARVNEHVARWWPTAQEKRFDQIGWAEDIRSARKLASKHDRPVFLFTMDGRVNLGRC
jgi:hypothetical protein